MRRRIAAFVALVAAGGGIAGAQHWPSFRGPAATGVAEGHPTPVRWSAPANEHVLWKAPLPGISVSSPVVWGDRVFVTTAVSSDPHATFRHGLYGDVEPSKDVGTHTWRVMALDTRSGRVLWDQVAHQGAPRTKRHPKSSQASATPATDGRRVVAFFGSEGLYAYGVDGRLAWKKDLGTLNAGWFYDPDYEWGVASSPIIFEDLVILQCDLQQDSFVAAFRLSDGTEVWRTARDEIPSWSTPTVVRARDRAELVTNATRSIRAYDPRTGRELWRLSGNSEITVPTPFPAHGLVFAVSGYRGIQPIYAIRPGASGDITPPAGAARHEHLAWSRTRGGPYIPTPVVYGDYLYVCQNNGVLSVYDARTGDQKYQERLGGQGGAFSASPVAADGKIYLSSEDGDVFVVKAGPVYELLATNPMGEVLMATPAISEGVLFIKGMKHLYAIGAKP